MADITTYALVDPKTGEVAQHIVVADVATAIKLFPETSESDWVRTHPDHPTEIYPSKGDRYTPGRPEKFERKARVVAEVR